MKKLLLVAAFAVFGLTKSTAQEIQFGAKAGLNLSTLTGDIDDAKSKTGFHIGGMAEIKFSDVFSFQPELLYSTQGAKQETSETASSGGYTLESKTESKSKYNYLNLPLMAKYYVTEDLSIEAGPQIGFLMSADSEYEDSYTETAPDGSTMTDNDSGSGDIKKFSNGIDFAFNFGLGYKMDSGLNFAARYGIGLSQVNKSADGDGGAAVKNSVFQISVGYFFK